MNTFIPLSVPNLKGNEKKYVVDAIEKEWVSTGGAYIEQFETNIAKYLNVPAAVACQSGTSGLHLALKLCDVGYGDAVIVPTLTFIAAVNPVKYLEAEPIFMDCDDGLTMDSEKLLTFLETECLVDETKVIHKKTKRQIKAIVVVHVFGNSADLEKIVEIANRYHLKVVEDATEALGTYYLDGKYKGQFLGTIGDFGVYSFNGNKIITTGGGGMLVAKDQVALQKAKYLSTQAKDDTVNFIHDEVGYNYRMTNLQAAVGVAQLEQLEQFIEIKTRNYQTYSELFEGVEGITLMPFKKNIRPNYWFYSLCINEDKTKITRDELIKALYEENIQTRPVWGLIHEQKPYRDNETYHIEKAIEYRRKIINIPCSSNLSIEDIKRVAESIKKLVGKRSYD